MQTLPVRSTWVLAATLGCALAVAQSDVAPEVAQLARIRRKAAEDLGRLSSFTCLASVSRAERRPGRKAFVVIDQVRAEVAYVGGRELFAWPGSAKFEANTLSQVVGSGLIADGDFMTHVKTVLVNGGGVIRYGGEEEFAGRPAVRYDYSVSPLMAGYELRVPEGSAKLGMKGSFWADRQSLDLIHLLVEAVDVPAYLGVHRVETQIDYGRTRIGDSEPVLMPQSAVMVMERESGKTGRNQVEFTHCREYRSSATISFDARQEEPNGTASQVPGATEIVLPAGLILETRLESAVDSAVASVGDAITARVERDVQHRGVTMIPMGARLTGRLRMLQRDSSERWAVGFEFTDLTFGERHARFLSTLDRIDSLAGMIALQASRRSGGGRTPSAFGTTTETSLPPQLPGVASFFVLKPGRFQLPVGLTMEWRTVTLTK
jgi:hypothetical protein